MQNFEDIVLERLEERFIKVEEELRER